MVIEQVSFLLAAGIAVDHHTNKPCHSPAQLGSSLVESGVVAITEVRLEKAEHL